MCVRARYGNAVPTSATSFVRTDWSRKPLRLAVMFSLTALQFYRLIRSHDEYAWGSYSFQPVGSRYVKEMIIRTDRHCMRIDIYNQFCLSRFCANSQTSKLHSLFEFILFLPFFSFFPVTILPRSACSIIALCSKTICSGGIRAFKRLRRAAGCHLRYSSRTHEHVAVTLPRPPTR